LLPAESREDLKTSIAAIKQKHNVKGELKWNKISPAYFDLYYEIINYFFETPYLRYRVIVIESEKADTLTFHNGDVELIFTNSITSYSITGYSIIIATIFLLISSQ